VRHQRQENPRHESPVGRARAPRWTRKLAEKLLISALLPLTSQACTIDLTDPPVVGNEPQRLSIAFSVADLQGNDACWALRVSARPFLRDGRFVPVADSTVRVAGETHLPGPRAHELASFIYQTAPSCGARPAQVAIEVPFLEGVEDLAWPLTALPLPWEGESDPGLVPAGEIAYLDVPTVALPPDILGERRLDWTARVARSRDAAGDQEDHQLLSNSSEASGTVLPVGAPFTSVAGSVWEVRWGIFSRIDRATPSGGLEASLEYGFQRITRIRVVDPGEVDPGQG
jgi:hypothetical protein